MEQSEQGSQFQIALEKHFHRFGLTRNDDELAIVDAVSHRHPAAHPDALLLGGGNLVPDPLASDFPFELGKR
jgi:hypothetical protein